MAVWIEWKNFFLQGFGADSKGIGFTCRINIRKDDLVCQGKSPGKVLKECFCAGVGMRLENDPELLVRIILRRS